MNATLLLDTNVLVDLLRDRPGARAFFEALPRGVAVSVLSEAELYAGARHDREREVLASLLASYERLPLTSEIARQGGAWRRQWGPSHGTDLVDALIAATALEHDLPLLTLNVRRFPMLTKVSRPYPHEEPTA
jgi:predicted nucleic acid-binding protein